MTSLIPGETLRVLLVGVDEAIREEITEALAGRIGEYRLYWVSQPDLAPARAQDLAPHVVLLDDALAGANPGSLIKLISARAPGAAILVLVSAEAMAAAREAVLAGARGFVMKPIQADDLATSLRQVLAQRTTAPALAEERPSGRIVVFCAPKGGTGRTTLAINTAISLTQETGAPVALVDADYAAPALDVALNQQDQSTVMDILPRLARLDEDLISSVLASHASGIKVLLAPPPADLTHPISLPEVQQILVLLRRMFPWVLVDLGLPMDETAFAFLDGADRIVMSVLPEMVGLRNTRLMLDQLHERGYPDEKVWLVLNRSSMPGGVPAGDIEERLRVQIEYRIPDDQPLVTHSVNRGVPLVMSHPRSALGRAIRGFARQIADSAAGEAGLSGNPPQPRGGFFGRLRGR